MFKKYQLIFFILIIVIVSLAVTLIAQIKNTGASSKFSAVYIEGGDIYFGELSWFPSLKLKNGWYLQRGSDQTETPGLSLNPLSGVFWGPDNAINLNRNKVIFWARLRSDSQVARFLENPTAAIPPTPSLPSTP